MPKRIVIIDGHPAPERVHLCHAVADAYAAAAEHAGHEVRRIEIATMEFPLLRSAEDFNHGAPPPDIAEVQSAILWAEHLLIVYPLWLGTMPALLKGFFEQAIRPGFAIDFKPNGMWNKRLKGRSARIVVTMGMPALIYRWFFGAHSLKSLERNILHFAGIAPVRETLFGGIESASDARRQKWLERMKALGTRGA
jgi:putative NADPH-quinone reductase